MIPFEELAASGIDRATAARLNYRCTPDGGWEITYLDPQGKPYTYGDGVPFVRRKLKPEIDTTSVRCASSTWRCSSA